MYCSGCGMLCLPIPVPLFPDIYLFPSSSPFFFWPGLSFLHSHCIQQILESVNRCHINGIVHRDWRLVSDDSKRKKQNKTSLSSLWPLASLLHCLINWTINLSLSATPSPGAGQQSSYMCLLQGVGGRFPGEGAVHRWLPMPEVLVWSW